MEPTLVGEEVDATKAGGVGEDVFTEEYVTGDVGLKEYDYSYRDYNEPLVETGELDANMGPALSAVTDEGGVSSFASEAKKKIHFNQLWIPIFAKCQIACLSLPSFKSLYGAISYLFITETYWPSYSWWLPERLGGRIQP